MSDATPEDHELRRDPSVLQHLLFIGACWALLPFVYWEDYGWPGAPPKVPYGGDWIALDFTGLMTNAYVVFAAIYTVLTTWGFVLARKRPRKMSWAEYIIYVPLAVVGVFAAWAAYIVLE